MISQREVERKYAKLIQDVATLDYYKVDLTNRINCYSCPCGYITKTIDKDAGVTPMMITCRCCGGQSMSSFYKDLKPDHKPDIEWFRPTLKDCLKLRNKPAILDHILQGGLDYRKAISNG